MVKKAENARERFESAAYALFQDHGYAETTVPQIAAKAGLTERTFYRYFSDKREVMFWRADAHRSAIMKEIMNAPVGLHPLDVVAGSFSAIAPFIDGHRPIVKLRQSLISAYVELHERELMKLHNLALAIDSGLQQRGIQPSFSRVLAEIGAAVFKVALQNWRADEAKSGFVHHVQAASREFQAGLHKVAG
ncbi:TetR/AcrR family transcriptional regulator [Aurantimonas endophytica]|uniref:AcrR family transcriptional regulator n=1 Tax=Aurantimonas endophytica TaxID=1522175 RepID=A0A7W6HII6_9HYPH|nr:TetR/AcrR family transcriptional regulator [Aurantimonas endophytica]MBB4005578.1 AcrR family transcriptional regulator [Aurantimonas endophytica]MCO6406456.1 TetR family transcriptional regulator [Aurantimonas endophytica]